MRALAAALTAIADQAGSRAGTVIGLVNGLTFEGPAATAFCERMQGWQTAVTGEAHQLQDLARRLYSAAGIVEAEQRLAQQRAHEAELEQAGERMANHR